MTALSAILVLLFALWLMTVSLFMLAKPQKSLDILKLMGSSAPIHFGEVIPRFFFGLGVFGIAATQAYPIIWKTCGGFLSVSAIALMLAPRRWHHAYSRYWGERMRPAHIRMCAPISLILSAYLACAAIKLLA
ncbi:MAG: hypothetical protein ACPGVT_10160 [Maricaulaceae bacterium]